MARNLKTVTQMAADGPMSEGSLRWHIFNAENNGLAASGAIVRVPGGRRIYIDVDKFDAWLTAQNPPQAST